MNKLLQGDGQNMTGDDVTLQGTEEGHLSQPWGRDVLKERDPDGLSDHTGHSLSRGWGSWWQ